MIGNTLKRWAGVKENGVKQLREVTLFFHFITFINAWLKVEGREKSISIQGHIPKAVWLNKGVYLGGYDKNMRVYCYWQNAHSTMAGSFLSVHSLWQTAKTAIVCLLLSTVPEMWVYISLIKKWSLCSICWISDDFVTCFCQHNTAEANYASSKFKPWKFFILRPSLGTLFLSCEKPSLAYLMMKTHSPVNTYHLRAGISKLFL